MIARYKEKLERNIPLDSIVNIEEIGDLLQAKGFRKMNVLYLF
jgi:hypothetical protein